MKILAGIGLVGTLCTFAIIAWMAGKSAETLAPQINNLEGVNKSNKKTSKGSALPMPHTSRIVLRNVHFALQNYRTSRGDFPRAASTKLSDPSSNDILRLLFKNGMVSSEKDFGFNGSLIASKTADGITTGNQALAPGENHWAYIEPPRPISHYGTVPVLIEPFRPGETSYRAEDYGGSRGVLVLFSDGSTETATLNDKGMPMIRGSALLSSDFPAWRGDTPKVYQPAR